MTVIRSSREELEELGIITTGTPDVRQAIRDLLCHHALTPEIRAQLVKTFKELQDQYHDKDVRRRLEPTKIGRVQHIRPRRQGNFRSPVILQEIIWPLSQFEAYIKWNGTKKGCYLRLDQIDLIPA